MNNFPRIIFTCFILSLFPAVVGAYYDAGGKRLPTIPPFGDDRFIPSYTPEDGEPECSDCEIKERIKELRPLKDSKELTPRERSLIRKELLKLESQLRKMEIKGLEALQRSGEIFDEESAKLKLLQGIDRLIDASQKKPLNIIQIIDLIQSQWRLRNIERAEEKLQEERGEYIPSST